ncbi:MULTISPECIES: hypothetical protein [Tsukamurella]|uniref:Uncharacterized protein n=2 Tax=Tsukamurella TaxID=2060 RepID=A0A5C5RYL2_9ACTN|nr:MULTISPECIES: hypothetical protein [Tsukamurella]NMD54309.1 hypothetical protein [Tsukamurella columbiensis]TWS28177.1 hypothetical protein FK530_13925 [Tsukamurella conjunctivitidis]
MTYNQGGYPPRGPYPPGGGQSPSYPARPPQAAPHSGAPAQPGGPWGTPQHGYDQPGQPQYGQPQYGGSGPYGGGPAQYGVPGPAEPGGPAATRGGIGAVLQFLIAGAAAFVIIGAFLPWATASATIGGSSIRNSASGIDGSDGWITLVVAFIAAGVAVAAAVLPATGVPLRLVSGITAAVAGLVITGLAGYDLANVVKLTSTYSSLVDVSAGIGLYLTLLAGSAVLGLGIGAIVAAVMTR